LRWHDELDIAFTINISQNDLLVVLLRLDFEVSEWIFICTVREVKYTVGHRDRPDTVQG